MLSNPTNPWFQDEEYLAEDYLVTIQPNFNTGEPLRMIASEYGPFDRRMPLSIPLWMAIYLERHGKCTIIAPAWLRVENLKARIRDEREKGTTMFSDMDDMILQVGTVLLNREYLNVEYLGGPAERNAMSALLLELMLIRKSKAVDGMKQIDVTSTVIDISKMTSLERATIRPQASRMVDQLRDLWLVRETVLGAESRGILQMTVNEPNRWESKALECAEGARNQVKPSDQDQKRSLRKRKAPVNFRLNKILVRADSSDEVLSVVGEHLSEFNIVNIGTALYRLALVGGSQSPSSRDNVRNDDRFSALIKEIVETLEGDSERDSLQQVVLAPKELSNIIWAATKLGLNDSNLFSAVAKHVVRHMNHFDSVNLSLTLWGFAKMDMHASEMFHAARGRIVELLPEFEPHRICNTVWAFAKTGNTDLELFRLVAEESIRKLHRFNHSNESMLLYSYALGHVHAPLLFRRTMAQQLPAIRSGEVLDPRSLSNLLWAISELNLSGEFQELYEAVSSSAKANIHRYSLTHMATIASAYAKANLRSDELFRLMAEEAASRSFDDDSQFADLSVLEEAFNHFEIDSGVIHDSVSRIQAQQREVQSTERKSRVREMVVDLASTSLIAAIVLFVAAFLRMYFA